MAELAQTTGLKVGHEKLGHFRYQPFQCAIQSMSLSPPGRCGCRPPSGPDASCWEPGQRHCAGASEPGFHALGLTAHPHLFLNSFCASLAPRKSTLPDLCLSVLTTQCKARDSVNISISLLGGGNPIYSLIFHTLRGAAKDPTRGRHFSGRGSSLLPL